MTHIEIERRGGSRWLEAQGGVQREIPWSLQAARVRAGASERGGLNESGLSEMHRGLAHANDLAQRTASKSRLALGRRCVKVQKFAGPLPHSGRDVLAFSITPTASGCRSRLALVRRGAFGPRGQRAD
jgi:hypothetical protein